MTITRRQILSINVVSGPGIPVDPPATDEHAWEDTTVGLVTYENLSGAWYPLATPVLAENYARGGSGGGGLGPTGPTGPTGASGPLGPQGVTGSPGIVFSPTAPATTVLWADTSVTGTQLEHICTSGTRPSSPYFGMWISETDTLRTLRYDGTGWIITGEPLQSGFTPTVTPASGSFTTLGTKVFQYQRCDGILTFTGKFPITTLGTASGQINFTLPFASLSGVSCIGWGRETALSGKMLQIISGAAILAYDNTAPWASGQSLEFAGQYPMASVYS